MSKLRHPRSDHPPEEAEYLPVSFDRSLRVATVAAILDCDETMVRRLVAQGKLRAHRLGKRGIRIYLSSIDAYRQSLEISPPRQRPEANAPTRRKQRPSAAQLQAMAHLKSLGIF